MKPITGRMMCQEVGADQFDPPEPAAGFMFVSGEMLRAAQILGQADPLPSVALTHLVGHVVETALKGMLSHHGLDLKAIEKLGHRLTALWRRAEEQGIPLPSQPPIWLEQLDRVHKAPYPNRYPVNCHGVVLPAQEAMLQGAIDLHKTATRFIAELQPGSDLDLTQGKPEATHD